MDEMAAIDHRARAIIELCRGCWDPERLDPFVIGVIGNLFHDLLDRRRVMEHFFLGVALGDRIEDARARAEIKYLKARYATERIGGGS
jgi:hypothetical protein